MLFNLRTKLIMDTDNFELTEQRIEFIFITGTRFLAIQFSCVSL